MNYDEDLLVELIAAGDVSQTEIARIADTVEGIRQATIRMATKWMKPLLAKQIKVALEGDGETSRKCREFLLKTFVITVPEQAAKAAAKRKPRRTPDRPLDPIALGMSLMELSPDLKDRIVEELGGSAEELEPVIGNQSSVISERQRITDNENIRPIPESTEDTDVEEATDLVSPSPTANSQLPTATPLDKCKKVADPFDIWVDGPHGKKVYAHAVRAIEEAKAEEAARPTRRRVKRSPQ